MVPTIVVGQMEDDVGTREDAPAPCTSSSTADSTPNWSECPGYANRTRSKATIPGRPRGESRKGWFAVRSEKSEDWWCSSPNTKCADYECQRNLRYRTSTISTRHTQWRSTTTATWCASTAARRPRPATTPIADASAWPATGQPAKRHVDELILRIHKLATLRAGGNHGCCRFSGPPTDLVDQRSGQGTLRLRS